jgi:hypothetical protein
MLKTLVHGSLRHRFATLNASADDLALRCFVLRVLSSSPYCYGRCPLTLDGSYLLCLHALSSFQRTGMPTSPITLRRSPPIDDSRRFQGNLLRLLPATTLVKPFFAASVREPQAGRLPAMLWRYRDRSTTAGLAPVRRTFQDYDAPHSLSMG